MHATALVMLFVILATSTAGGSRLHKRAALLAKSEAGSTEMLAAHKASKKAAATCQEAAISEGSCASGLRMRCPAALPPAKAIQGVPLLVEDLSNRVGEGDGLPTYAVSVLYHEWPGQVRSPIKQYDRSGMLCVKRGKIRLVVQGAPGKAAKTGECLMLPIEPLSVVSSDKPAQFFLYVASPGHLEVDGRICEPSSQWSLGMVECPTCSEVHEQQCKRYDSCARRLSADVPLEPCDYACMINGEPAPTSQWFVPTTARSDNAGKVIAMEPSYPVQGGHSGDMLDYYAVSGSGAKNFPGNNHRLYAERTTRVPFTRALVHTHDWMGVTCVQQGEMTLLLDGMVESVTVREGGCYWMPSGRYMTGMNSGNVTALMWDLYTLPAETQAPLPYTTINLIPFLNRGAPKDDICRAEGGVLVDGATFRPLSPMERFNESKALVQRIKENCDLNIGPLEPLLAPYPACECIGHFNEKGSVEWALK